MDTGGSGSAYGGAVEPCTVVLFGASGDLAKRKVIPAMYDLAIHNALEHVTPSWALRARPCPKTLFAWPWATRPRASRK